MKTERLDRLKTMKGAIRKRSLNLKMKDDPMKAEDNGSNIKKQESVIWKIDPVRAINHYQERDF